MSLVTVEAGSEGWGGRKGGESVLWMPLTLLITPSQKTRHVQINSAVFPGHFVN